MKSSPVIALHTSAGSALKAVASVLALGFVAAACGGSSASVSPPSGAASVPPSSTSAQQSVAPPAGTTDPENIQVLTEDQKRAQVQQLEAKLGCPTALIQSGHGFSQYAQTAAECKTSIPDPGNLNAPVQVGIDVFGNGAQRDTYTQEARSLGGGSLVQGPNWVISVPVGEDAITIKVAQLSGGSVV